MVDFILLIVDDYTNGCVLLLCFLSFYFFFFNLDLVWNKLSSMHPDKRILFVILITLCITNANNIFESGKKYTYSYVAESNSGVLLPSRAASSWGFQGQLDIQAIDNVVQLQVYT